MHPIVHGPTPQISALEQNPSNSVRKWMVQSGLVYIYPDSAVAAEQIPYAMLTRFFKSSSCFEQSAAQLLAQGMEPRLRLPT